MEEAARRFLEAGQLPEFHREGLHDAIAGDGLVQDVLDLGQLVLPMAGGVANATPHTACGADHHRNEDDQHPGQLAAHDDNNACRKDQGEELLQEFRQHRRHRVLDALDVIDDGGQDGAGRVPLEELHGATQDGLVQVVPHVHDHAEARIVNQIGAGVVADPLQHRGDDQCEGDDVPGIVEMRGNKLLQTKVKTAAEEAEVVLWRLRIEDRLEDRPDEQDAEGIQKADRRQQHDRCKSLEGIAAHIEQQSSNTSKPAHRCNSEAKTHEASDGLHRAGCCGSMRLL